jgi:hypothetical protein
MTSKNMEQRAETSNVEATPGTQTSSTTPCFGTCIGNYDTRIEYDMVSGEIRMSDVGKVFVNRLKESCLQRFKDHLHLSFSKIPMHLHKAVIHDMESEFGIGWSVKKVKRQMSQNCKRFRCNQTKKIKKLPPELRLKKRPIDVSIKVWKELVKSYEKSDAWRKSGEESIQVFQFAHNIISNFLNDFYILFVHSSIDLLYVSGQSLQS